MASKKDIVKALQTSHQMMIDTLNSMDVDKEIYSGWTVKEVLAHITGWDEAITASLSSFIQGGKPGLVAVNGVDSYNADSVAKRKKLSLDATFEDWKRERDHLLATISALPENQVNDKIMFPHGGSGTVGEMLLWVADHENRHRNDIQNA